jgi:hypothetical protein
MKRNILKSIACLCLVGLVWSCSTENDVQMQSSNSQFQQKDGSLLEGVIGVDHGNGIYEITVDEDELLTELDRLWAVDGDPVKFETVSIVKKTAVNNPSYTTFILLAGTGVGETTMSMGIDLGQIGNSFQLQNPSGGGGTITSCRGCGTGCFLEYYEIDGHHLAYCDPYGCGSNCEKSVKKG